MDSQRPGGTAHVAVVVSQGADDELALELFACLIQGQTTPYELIHDAGELAVEIGWIHPEKIPHGDGRVNARSRPCGDFAGRIPT